MTDESFRGALKPLSLADILDFLGGLRRPGLLSLSGPAVSVGLYLRDGRLVHAASSREADRLTSLLLAWGTITPEQHDETLRRVAEGTKVGRALLDGCGLTPRGLFEARVRQARRIALSAFEWGAGQFVFQEGEEPPDRSVEVDVPVAEVIAEAIRALQSAAYFEERLPSPEWVFVPRPAERPRLPLEPHEEQVLRLVDGSRTLGQVVAESEYPAIETRRILFLLQALGYVLLRPAEAPGAEDNARAADLDAIAVRYNGLFGQIHDHLMREIGPIAEPLLERSLSGLEAAHGRLVSGAGPGGDGTLDGTILRQNFRRLGSGATRATLIEGLNEVLYAQLLVVRRVLGAEHEARLMKVVRRLRHEPGPGAAEA